MNDILLNVYLHYRVTYGVCLDWMSRNAIQWNRQFHFFVTVTTLPKILPRRLGFITWNQRTAWRAAGHYIIHTSWLARGIIHDLHQSSTSRNIVKLHLWHSRCFIQISRLGLYWPNGSWCKTVDILSITLTVEHWIWPTGRILPLYRSFLSFPQARTRELLALTTIPEPVKPV